MRSSPLSHLCAAAVTGAAFCLVFSGSAATVLYSDDFEADRSADWSVLDGSGTAVPDFKVDWAFDYSAVQYTANGVTRAIPLAPNSAAGAARGVRVNVNKNDDVADTAAVNLYSKTSFSGDFALRFDMWINYNGPRYGGTGSTEFGIAGINFLGTQANWPAPAALPLPDSDGLFFGVTGEGGAAGDYRAYEGISGSNPARLPGVDGGFLDRDGDGVGEVEAAPSLSATSPLHLMFPTALYETPGVSGKSWAQCEVRQQGGLVTWSINGYVIAQRPSSTQFTEGSVMIGMMDIFASIASPKEDNYVLFDNVRVVGLLASDMPVIVEALAVDAEAAESGGDTGKISITRTGATTGPLTVNFRWAGEAVAGSDFATPPSSVTIPAGASSADVVVTPLDDNKGEQPERAMLVLVGSRNYDIFTNINATVTLADDGDVTGIQILRADVHSYEPLAADPGSVTLVREGDIASALTVNFLLGGTATKGTDYTDPGATLTFGAGETNAVILLEPLDDTQLEGSETIEVTLLPGSGYGLPGTATTVVTLRDNEQTPGTVLYSDDMDGLNAANWAIFFGAGNNVADYQADFGYDYSQDGIPPAPSSASAGNSRGLKTTANKDGTGSAAAVNVYLKSKTFSGDYAVRFDMFLNVNLSAAGTTEHAIFGLNHGGTLTNRHAAAGSDGYWFAVETDGSGSGGGRSYVSYAATNAAAAPSFVTKPATEFADYFGRPPFAAAGAAAGAWVDVELTQLGSTVTAKINGVTVASRENATRFQSGKIMLGHMDTFNSIGGIENSTIFDNLRVVQLSEAPSAPPEIRTISAQDAKVQITFTGAAGKSYALQGKSVVNGTWAAEPGAQVTTGVSPGQFAATAPLPADGVRFYRVAQQ